ncbi:hypothetical protein F8S13_23885 [Chloroflexia bacterium SDU3-3]|nr:hypothetical protein F8S13_23885 [Chloroflexia bacterium SDU3-3]
MRYEIRHISVRSTIKFGILAGASVSFLPAIAIAFLALQLIGHALDALANMQHVVIDLPTINLGIGSVDLPTVPVDFVQSFGLGGALSTMQQLHSGGAMVFLLILAVVLVVGSLFTAMPLLGFVMFYNSVAPRGGIAVDLVPRERR